MHPTWPVKDLQEYIRERSPEAAPLLHVLDSVGRYVDLFRYHLFEARDAMKGVVADDDPLGVENSKFVFGISPRQGEYRAAKIASEAHILGCIHSARALFDVFAFLVNGLILENAVREDRCSVSTVVPALPTGALRDRLQILLDSHWYKYVCAFVNTAKHRYLIRHGYWVSFESGAAEIRLEGFTYNGESYATCSAEDVLKGALEVKNAVVECGNLLNACALEGAV